MAGTMAGVLTNTHTKNNQQDTNDTNSQEQLQRHHAAALCEGRKPGSVDSTSSRPPSASLLKLPALTAAGKLKNTTKPETSMYAKVRQNTNYIKSPIKQMKQTRT